LLDWFDEARRRLLTTFAALDPGLRVPWYGPPMSAASSVTARLMETWAHGQDVADALGVTREPTDRLRHVAHIGVRAMPFSYALHGRPAPTAPVRVELTAPGGESWTWGPQGVPDLVRGPALDFCLLVTQRRHRADLALRTTGPVATEWLSIAQAFAGEPGKGAPRCADPARTHRRAEHTSRATRSDQRPGWLGSGAPLGASDASPGASDGPLGAAPLGAAAAPAAAPWPSGRRSARWR